MGAPKAPWLPLSGELDFCGAKRLRGSRSLPPSKIFDFCHLPRQREARALTRRGRIISAPTMGPRAFRKLCRGRRSRRPASAGCRQAPAPTSSREGRLWCCRAACPQAAVNIRQQFDRRGGMSPKGTSVGRGHPALREDKGLFGFLCQSPSQKSEIFASPLYTRGPLVRRAFLTVTC